MSICGKIADAKKIKIRQLLVNYVFKYKFVTST